MVVTESGRRIVDMVPVCAVFILGSERHFVEHEALAVRQQRDCDDSARCEWCEVGQLRRHRDRLEYGVVGDKATASRHGRGGHFFRSRSWRRLALAELEKTLDSPDNSSTLSDIFSYKGTGGVDSIEMIQLEHV